MKKSLRNLAKVAAGLGAAYAISKIGKTDDSESINAQKRFIADLGTKKTLNKTKDVVEKVKKFEIDDELRELQLNKFGPEREKIIVPIKRSPGDPSSMFKPKYEIREAFVDSPSTRRAKSKIRTLGAYSKGGTVVTKGQGLASRSKVTKIC